MRTLQIVGNARFGGATTVMLSWSRFLLHRGCEVDILCTDERMRAEAATLRGANVIDDIFIPKEIDPRADVAAFIDITRLCRARHYDIVHTYTATPSFIGRLAASAAGVEAVINHQGGWAVNELSTTAERFVYTPLEYLATLACTRNICVSHAERTKAADLRLAPDRKLTTIVNGVDVEPFDAAAARRREVRSHYGWDNVTTVIGTTGRLVPGKGNDTAIRAIRHLVDTHPNGPLVLALAGDGDDRAELEQLANDLGVADHVQFLGFVGDIAGFLAAIDIFATPTHTEGLSVSVLEAMASSRPVVATNIPPNAEIVDHERTGLLFDVGDDASLAASVARLINDRTLRTVLGDAGRNLVRADYSERRMFDETWRLYCELTSATTSPARETPESPSPLSKTTAFTVRRERPQHETTL